MAQIKIDFLANIEGFTKDIAKSTSQAAGSFNKLQAGIAGIQAALLPIAATVGAVVAAFKLFDSAISEAQAAEEAINRLGVAFKLSGVEAESAVPGIIALANEIQATTKIADDAVLETAATLQTLGRFTEDGLKQATIATADLAAALQIDLQTAATLVGKAADGNVSALKRYGIAVKEGSNASETFANVLDQLNTRFGGAAAAQTNTFSGAIAQLKNAFSDALETIGLAIIQNEDLIKTIKSLSSIIKSISPVIAKLASLIGSAISEILSSAIRLREVFLRVARVIVESLASIFDLLERALSKLPPSISGLFESIRGPVDFLKDSTDKALKGLNNLIEARDQLASSSAASPAGAVSSRGSLLLPGPRGGDGKAESSETKQREKLLKQEEDAQKKFLGQLGSFVANLRGGAAGVSDTIATVGGLFAESIIPGLGQVATQLLGFLSQGPEAVKAQIQAFVENIPVIIQAIVDSIPAVIDGLIAGLPRFIESLAAQSPFIAVRLSTELAARAPEIVGAFIKSIIEGGKQFVQTIINEIKGAIGGIGRGVGGFLSDPIGAIGGAVSSVGKFFGFAEGGIVPGGAPFTDRVPAFLTPGERVLTRDEVKNGQNQSDFAALARVLDGQSQNVTINLVVGEEQLASTILNLNRRGFRLA